MNGGANRVGVDGRHLRVGAEPFRVRGVTYGSFKRRLDDSPFPERSTVKRDLNDIARAGLNTVRTYELPPDDLLEFADESDLRVLVGLQYHDWRIELEPGRAARRRIRNAGLSAVRDAMERLAGHPTVLAVSVGNEVPADLVRLHGAAAVEDGLSELANEIRRLDDGMLVTYSNFPTTEYLRVEGLDICSFNVFLEDAAALRSYLRHLMTVADDRPLLLTEVGLAGAVHGEEEQARSLDSQLRLVDECGSAGATVFAWTDEWAVAEAPVEGWGFGITTADREPKPAFETVSRWATRELVDVRDEWPSVSVVVCAYNEAATIEQCLDSLVDCEYPNFEVIVCDDGSTDDTLALARRYPFTVLALPHAGLSVARNAGLAAATGEIVAYLDADAACHREWLFHVALSLEDPGTVGSGGPNLPMEDADLVERAVAVSPGGPVHVLITDDRAEHVPGCNMAFRRHALEAVGGFDASYTSAGDDVDVCWKLLDQGGEIAFAPAAQVRHRRRRTVRAYLKQQCGYGRSERMVSGHHPHRFNRLGQARWNGFIYGGQRLLPKLLRPVVYHGYHGHAPFQPVVSHRAERALELVGAYLPLLIPAAIVATAVAMLTPLNPAALVVILAVFPLYGLAVALTFRPPRDEPEPIKLRALVGFLHATQPLVRTWGRVRAKPLAPRAPEGPVWNGQRAAWLDRLAGLLAARRCATTVAPPTAGYDMIVSIGPFVSCRLTTAVAWSWTPAVRVQYRPRALAVLACAALVALAAVGASTAAVVLFPVAAAVIAGEAVVLRSRVREAVAVSTSGAA